MVYLIFCGENMILCFNESTGISKKSYLAKVVFHELCFGKWLELMAMLHLLEVRASMNLFSIEMCKVTFGF